MSDEHDPILDACLDEVLGGKTPPDLTPRIMQAWSMLPPALPSQATVAPPVQTQAVSTSQNQVTVKATQKVSGSATGKPRVSGFSVSMVVAASVLAIGLAIGFSLRPTPPAENDEPIAANRPETIPNSPQPAAAPEQEAVAQQQPSVRLVPQRTPEVITPDFSTDPPFPVDIEKRPFELAVSPPAVTQQPDPEVVSTINVAIRAAWQAHNITPAPQANDNEFANRLYPSLIGRLPTAAEVQALIDSRDKDKRRQLVDELLTSEDHVVEFARHWSDIWADVLVGRAGTVAEKKASRAGLQQYLGRALQQSKPMDQVVTELLTATGSGEIGSSQYNGAANFLLAHYDGKATRATAQVARAFLGKRLQCAQCHDHPGDSLLAQNRFWELNTFLRQVAVERRQDDPSDTAVLASRDFGGDGADAEVFYETSTGEVKVAFPALPGVADLPRSGVVAEFDRRAGLARYIATSADFRQAVVNRVWSNIFGYGFTSPVDDMGQHNPPSHPELLDALANQFAAHKHDLRSLIRWIVLSEPFQLGSDQGIHLADAPELGQDRWFSRAYPPVKTEAVAQESLLALARATGSSGLGVGTTANVKPSFPSPGRGALDGKRPATSNPLSIASPSVGQATSFVPAMIGRIVDSSMSNEQKLEHLFLATVQRSPTNRERTLVKQITGDEAAADRATLLQIWWSLDRSNEFGLDR